MSLDSQTIRLQISNVFGGSDLPITAVSVALPTNNTAGVASIEPATAKPVTFSGSESFTVPNGAVVFSDPITFDVKAQSILSISIFLKGGQTTNSITSHPGSRTSSFFSPGNRIADANLTDAARAEHWYFISAVESYLPRGASAVAIVGDSITDGRGSTNNLNNRWPDSLLASLQSDPETRDIAIINQAAGGNRVLADGLGPNALGRIDRDVIAHSGVRYCIVFEGVNDIGTAPTDAASQKAVGDRLILAFDQMTLRLHRFGIPVFGATITPFSGPGQSYSDPTREQTRQRVNEWIRTSGRFDAVIDFDAMVRNASQPDQLAEAFNTGDFLHLNPQGYEAMGKGVDLAIFKRFEAGVSRMTR